MDRTGSTRWGGERRALPGARASRAALVAAGAVSGCGDISRDSASSALSSQLATASGFPSSIDKNALVSCVIGKLYDSGQFNNSEIQTIIKATSSSDIDAALNTRVQN